MFLSTLNSVEFPVKRSRSHRGTEDFCFLNSLGLSVSVVKAFRLIGEDFCNY